MAGPNTGGECKLYYNTGTFGSPTWTEIPGVIDLNWAMDATYADISSRRSIFRMEAKALTGLTVNWGYRRRQGVSDTVFTALRGYALARTKFELAIADGAIATTGTQYLRATYQCHMNRDEPLEDGASDSFEAHLTYEEDSGTMREPAWTVV